jgi:hypothetical protein
MVKAIIHFKVYNVIIKVMNAVSSIIRTIEKMAFYVIMAVVVIISACSDDEEVPLTGTKYSFSDIAGSWNATSALIFSLSVAQPETVDIMDEGGSLTLAVQSNRKFTLTIVRPGRADEISTGNMGFDEEWVAMAFDDAPNDYSYMFIQLDDPRENMIIRGETEYDFDLDGTEELTSVDLEMVRI